jgi:hypothetical protein
MGNFLLDEWLLVFSEGLYYVKLVNWLVGRPVSSFVVAIPVSGFLQFARQEEIIYTEISYVTGGIIKKNDRDHMWNFIGFCKITNTTLSQ